MSVVNEKSWLHTQDILQRYSFPLIAIAISAMASSATFQSKLIFQWLTRFLQFHLASFMIALTLTMMPTLGESHDSTDSPPGPENLTKVLSNSTHPIHSNSSGSASSLASSHDVATGIKNKDESSVKKTATVVENNGVPKEFPSALVIASSIAAVSILIFFLVSYYWHTHQLDSRARKLAIRMAAEAEHSMRCSNCNPPPRPTSSGPSRSLNRGYIRAASDSSQEPNTCDVLTMDEERAEVAGGSMGGRSSIVVSESDTGDPEDVFEPTELPQLTRGARGSIRGGRGGHKKWGRGRKSSGLSLEGKRDSAVTDKEILTHFASRRHSTFFI